MFKWRNPWIFRTPLIPLWGKEWKIFMRGKRKKKKRGQNAFMKLLLNFYWFWKKYKVRKYGKMLSFFSSIGLIGNRRLTDTEEDYGMMILLLRLALACQPQRQKEVASFVLGLHRLPARIFTLTEFNSLHLFSFLVLLNNILNQIFTPELT